MNVRTSDTSCEVEQTVSSAVAVNSSIQNFSLMKQVLDLSRVYICVCGK